MSDAIGTAVDPSVVTEAALRDAVLAGRFFTHAHAAAAMLLAEFLHLDPQAALRRWFGTDTLRAAVASGVREALDRDIAALDAMIAVQLDTVLHHPSLQRLEAAWRGVWSVVVDVPPSSRVKVKLLDARWPELCRDLDRAAEFDRSVLFRKVYEDEFGSPGGEPFGLLVVDHEVRHRPAPGSPTDDISALALLSQVAAAAFAPVVLGASPNLLGVDRFGELATVLDLAGAFRSPDHARWRALASREDMRFVAVTAPRVLARPRWGDDPMRSDGLRHLEDIAEADDLVWMSAAYAFAACAARAFLRHGWPADVRGVDTDREGGGLVLGLVAERAADHPNDAWSIPPLDLLLTDTQERALIDLGLMPLCGVGFTSDAVFGAVRSLQSPAAFAPDAQARSRNAAAARANARLSSHVNSMLCASRFAHYIKMLGRDMVGSILTATEIQGRLQRWLMNYVNSNMSAGPEQRARAPLVDARVSVDERVDRPGVFDCVILLQPHHQLDDVSASFRLVTDLVAPGASR